MRIGLRVVSVFSLIQFFFCSSSFCYASENYMEHLIVEDLRSEYEEFSETRYQLKWFDLNGDGNKEAIVYVAGPYVCGTGGCDTLIYSTEGSILKVVSRISITRSLIIISKNTTNKWHNLIIYRSGGGGPHGFVELAYDGTAYPGSTNFGKPVECDIPYTVSCGPVIIEMFESLSDLRKLFPDLAPTKTE